MAEEGHCISLGDRSWKNGSVHIWDMQRWTFCIRQVRDKVKSVQYRGPWRGSEADTATNSLHDAFPELGHVYPTVLKAFANRKPVVVSFHCQRRWEKLHWD